MVPRSLIQMNVSRETFDRVFFWRGIYWWKIFGAESKMKMIVDVPISRMNDHLDCKWATGTSESENAEPCEVEYWS